jgi:hypothetical protein
MIFLPWIMPWLQCSKNELQTISLLPPRTFNWNTFQTFCSLHPYKFIPVKSRHVSGSQSEIWEQKWEQNQVLTHLPKGCRVRQSVQGGALSPRRYRRWRLLHPPYSCLYSDTTPMTVRKGWFHFPAFALLPIMHLKIIIKAHGTWT